ncbi:MAG: polymerase PA [Bactrocera tryoni orthomyxo-like virus]|nr:MAG: polymerase PA [Bactrocera tryoni orthomyxo-like virus]
MDVQQKFKELVETSSLYPENFIKVFGKNDPHWDLETWKKRERALAHDMVCLLLSNLEAQHDAPTSILNEYIKKRKLKEREDELRNLMQPHTSTKRIRLDENVDLDEDEELEEIINSSSDEEDEINLNEIDPNLTLYRYIPLEGQSNPSHVQNMILEKWGFEKKTKTFDVIDMEDKKLIEVKFSKNIQSHIERYHNDPDTDENTILLVVSPDTGLMESPENKVMPGLSKSTVWVLHRKAVMESKGLTDYDYDENEDLSAFIFSNDKINTIIDEFSKFTLNEIPSQKESIEPEDTEMEIQEINCEFLFNNLTQEHLSGDKDIVKWTGKILPSCWKTLMEVGEKDDENIDSFFNYLDEEKVKSMEGDEALFPLLDIIKDKWDSLETENRHFSFINCKNKKIRESIDPSIKWALGIDRKNKKQNNIEGLKQDVFKELPHLKYDVWFDDLFTDLTKIHSYPREYPFILEKENDDLVEMYKEMQITVESFNKGVASREIGIMISEIENLYSRLCGAYLAGNAKTGAHSRIVIVPIISTFIRSSVKTRKHRISGIIIRGPTHTRSLSDRTNIVSIELLNEKFPIRAIKKHCLIEYESGLKILIRQNAYKKIDAPYNAYIKNALFGPTNLLGDIFNKTSLNTNLLDVRKQTLDLVSNKEKVDFFIERVIEGILMCVIGNTRDEGYFAMLRKIMMIFISIRRGNSTFSLNRKEFCNSINECIIDNPLSMYFHNSVLFVCAYYINGGM